MHNANTLLDVRKALSDFLHEDIGTGDITSSTVIDPDVPAKAKIVCKSRLPAIVSGLEEAATIFEICNCNPTNLVKDGSRVKKGTVVMEITGTARSILKSERTSLNLIMRMSGISTETNRFVDALGKYKSFTTIACTRKTAPGLRYFDKKAVVLGGGSTHRMRLDDMVLIKDNHLAIANSVTQSINMAKKFAGSSIKIECEAKNKKEAIEAINAGADIVMLDNFSASKAYNTIKSIEKMGARKRIKIEISGGINIKNIKQYVKAKPDIISIGYLTHSARAVDFSLDLLRLKSDKN